MTKMICALQALIADKKGVTAIEYGLIAAGIAVGISGAVVVFGDDLEALFTSFSALLG